ncbi:MAG: SDR family NAD(P)-dependent oxidoreductase [Azospirillaceae bacterium]
MTGREPPLIAARGLRLALPDNSRRRLWDPPPRIEILKGIDLTIARGESVGIVGESGSGKTTLGRTLVRLYRPTGGALAFDGADIAGSPERDLASLRRRAQFIFQDPQSSLNPRHRIRTILLQPFRAAGELPSSAADRRRTVAGLLDRVGLSDTLATRFPHELSGGQRQRVGIARAIALAPDIIVADEIVSGLDVSSQAQVLALLRRLRDEMGLTLAFISHDLSVVRVLCDRVVVMLNGEVVEEGPCERVFADPRHPYTRRLIEAIPLPDIDPNWLSDAPLVPAPTPASEPAPNENRSHAMKINGCTALVTGTSRGLGRLYVETLIRRGARKVYATARDTEAIRDLAERHPGVVEIMALDITNQASVDAAAKDADDVQLLINNAGVNHLKSLFDPDGFEAARADMECNYFGTLRMIRAFAPVLAHNGGGAIINMLSILARVSLPLRSGLAASKAASLSMTQTARAVLAKQGTHVLAVMPGVMDTEMEKDFPPPKLDPQIVADAALDAIESGTEEIYPGDMAGGIAEGLLQDAKAVERDLAQYQ